MPSPPTPYTLLPATLADMDAMLATGSTAFQHDPLRLATFPPELIDPADPNAEENWRRARFTKRLEDPGVVTHKVSVDGNGGVAGFAAWVRPGQGEGVGNAANPTGEVPRCVHLASLATHPDHQGKGIGAALVRWGIEQGEKDGVPVYLEATPRGFFLYKKMGFEAADEIDVSHWTPNGESYKVICMIKRPSLKAQ
ncbi:putative gnat family [Diplodia seriata]|uniref:Putative gnat family n=1 Tax=Diplodia seriata TaxID=420778 RepID=A0A0G2GQK4_9PEZI|nr:putative gnat family [Diplodia seriata]